MSGGVRVISDPYFQDATRALARDHCYLVFNGKAYAGDVAAPCLHKLQGQSVENTVVCVPAEPSLSRRALFRAASLLSGTGHCSVFFACVPAHEWILIGCLVSRYVFSFSRKGHEGWSREYA